MPSDRFIGIFLYFLCITGHCKRRIISGRFPLDDKQYMVYFVKSNLSRPSYDAWLCGGAIVSATKILTAAACLVELNNIYAIAGYKHYVNGQDIDTNECTRRWKQRVVRICVHKDYKLNHSNPGVWLNLNVGIATVEKPYDFSDLSYRLYCSYVPAPIIISYQLKERTPGTNVMMLGWGNSGLRQPQDINDRNSEVLLVALSKIQYTRICRDNFNVYQELDVIVNNSLCVEGSADIDYYGNIVSDYTPTRNNNGCSSRRSVNGTLSRKCGKNDTFFKDYGVDSYDLRTNNKFGSNSSNNSNTYANISQYIRQRNKNRHQIKRKPSICQNDHGGPLVTWVGSSEVVIGVALTTIYANPDLCKGPSIFYDLISAKDWLQCLLASDDTIVKLYAERSKRTGCNLHGMDVNWKDQAVRN